MLIGFPVILTTAFENFTLLMFASQPIWLRGSVCRVTKPIISGLIDFVEKSG